MKTDARLRSFRPIDVCNISVGVANVSTEVYIRCDMCGAEFVPKDANLSNSAVFGRKTWREKESFDLCNRCADKVQKFIRSNGERVDDGN